MRKIIILCTAAVMALTGCNASNIDTGSDTRKDLELSTRGSEFIQKGNDFALDFLEKIDAVSEDSYVISPLSLQFLLGMILDGAQGRTADEICDVLGFGAGEKEQVNEYCLSLLKQLPKLDSSTTLKIANAILVDKSGQLLDSYKKSVANYYQAYVESIDFSNGDAAVKKINNWCRQNTNGMIDKIIDRIPPSTFACLMNALYFKGKWASTFDKAMTSDEAFVTKSGKKLRVPMMKQEEEFAYADNGVCQIVRLPYGNGAFSMVVALPTGENTVKDVIAAIKKNGWKQFAATDSYPSVDLWLPRFEAKFEGELNEMLKQLGMPTAFEGSADFGAMTEHPVCISLIKQKAVIKVNEEGSEAAAVSIGFMKETACMPESRVMFHADHPFLYFIVENSSGAILFSGRYSGAAQ